MQPTPYPVVIGATRKLAMIIGHLQIYAGFNEDAVLY